MKKALYLGLDASTQSLTAMAVDEAARRIVHVAAINYERDLPQYGVRAGVLPNPDPRIAHAPPRLWAEALDTLLGRLRAGGLDLSAVRALAVSGQQHGSVYLNAEAEARLAALRPDRPLAEQLEGIFARATAPIWMDVSTGDECAEIRAALGGAAAAAAVTGSDIFERFTGPQIRRFWKEDRAGYERTAHIALVSSFLSSLLIGRIAPLEPGDASGMSLMDIRAAVWHPPALAATAPDLLRRLPPIVPSDCIVGRVAPWLVGRHGFSPTASVAAGTGDNPSSLVGVGVAGPGTLVVSLGTSDTAFAAQAECRTDPRGEGHVFGAPMGGTMALVCFRNGSLARERVRDAFGLDWDGFTAVLRSSPPGNRGRLLLPWFEPEIVPRVPAAGTAVRGLAADDASGYCRAVVEGQMLAIRRHSIWIGPRPGAIRATGGAAANPEILRILADVFGCPVDRVPAANSAAIGAALRAVHADAAARGAPLGWAELADAYAAPIASARTEPSPESAAVYDRLLLDYAAFEEEELRRRGAACVAKPGTA